MGIRKLTKSRRSLRQPIIIASTAVLLVALMAGTAFAWTRPQGLAFWRKPANTQPTATSPDAAITVSPAPTSTVTPSPGSTPAATATPKPPDSVTTPATQALTFSPNNVTMTLGQNSPTFYVTVPDGSRICFPSVVSPAGFVISPVVDARPGECRTAWQMYLSSTAKAGSYTVKMVSDSPTKNAAGAYSRYSGTIKVSLGAVVSQFSATSSGQQSAYPYGSFTGVFADLTITPVSNFSGNPTVTYTNTGSQYCASQSLQKITTTSYMWNCQLIDPTAHHSFTMTFTATDNGTTKTVPVAISY